MSKPELISDFPIFEGFSKNNLTTIAQQIDVLELDADETVFEAGEDASNLYGGSQRRG